MQCKCPSCGAEFNCEMNEITTCWCKDMPNIVPLYSKECLCQKCLQNKISQLQKINISVHDSVFNKLQNLKSNTSPLFGKMTAQHMIEHLILAISFSNGKSPQVLMVDERVAKTIRHYTINTDKEMSIGFKAPMLTDNLVPLSYSNLNEAIEYLKNELNDFDLYFKNNPDSKPISPVIGDLNHQEWIIFHNKHFTHHFKQFGLI